MLILVGISIRALTTNGIITNSKTAANEQKIKEHEEKLNLILTEAQIDTEFEQDKTVLEKVKEKIEAEANKYQIKEETGNTLTIIAKPEGYTYEITENGVKYIEKNEEQGSSENSSSGTESNVEESTTYTITYAGLEGATLATANPTTYTNTSEDITLTNPTKSGYIFAGWTGTGLTSATKTVTITKGSTGARNYTATWTEEEKWIETEKWTQNKTTVTHGTITLEVGSQVTGYSANGVSNWYVLGAKDGKLLITTNSNVTTVTLSGQSGYTGGILTLNTEAKKYTNTNYAEGNARTIDVDDINRVTGYDPDVAKYNSGTYDTDQWDNYVTFTYHGNAYYDLVDYMGTKYPTTSRSCTQSQFTYWTGTQWKTLSSGESTTIKNTYYEYYPQTLSTTSSTATSINGSSKAYSLLCANTSSPYWLGSQYVQICGDFGSRWCAR